ncbi:MAG: hypothetical protein WC483_06600 [Candidatus Paceibacterota bacterium]
MNAILLTWLGLVRKAKLANATLAYSARTASGSRPSRTRARSSKTRTPATRAGTGTSPLHSSASARTPWSCTPTSSRSGFTMRKARPWLSRGRMRSRRPRTGSLCSPTNARSCSRRTTSGGSTAASTRSRTVVSTL